MEKTFSFFLVTDPHYFEASLGASGEAYEKRSITDQKCVAETGAIIDSGFADIAKDAETNVVLIPGDLVYRGEQASHEGFIKKLENLEEAGKSIYIITARHDYAGDPCCFIGSECIPVEGTPRENLRGLYHHYGFDQAISEHESLSYVVQLADGIRLLALNCDGDCKDFKGIWPDQMQWALEQIKKAHDDGQYIFAMTHYPLLPFSPIMSIIDDTKLTDWEDVATKFADAGLDLIFTGHMHAQAVTEYVTEKGNKITDVQTGCFVGCPCAYRKVTFLKNNTIGIKSLTINDFDWDKDGKSAQEYFQWRFDRMITWKMSEVLPDKVNKLLDKLTLKKIGRLLFFKVDKSLENILFKDLAIEIVRNIFIGDEPYVEGTPMYEAVKKTFKRLRPVIHIAEKKLGEKNPLFSDIESFVLSSIGDKKQRDHNTVLNIKWRTEK